MTIVGFDPAVARANGYPTRSTGGDVRAQGQVFGNCGFSYVDLYDVGPRRYHMDTGFGLKLAAVKYKWSVRITAPSYAKTWKYSGPLAFRTTWTNSPDGYDTIPVAAYASAIVTTGTAILVNGVVCASGQPTDLEAIY